VVLMVMIGRWLTDAIAVLKDWQTLAVGILAVGAAWWAARPVYRQLRETETQSNATLREVLGPRVAELERNKDRALAPGREAVAGLLREFHEMDEAELADFSEEGAFHHWQVVGSAADEYKKFRARRVDVPSIEGQKEAVSVALAHLEERLDDIHRPASMGQEGDDYAFTDQEWEAIEQRGEAARQVLPDAVRQWNQASDALAKAYDDEIARLRRRIVELDKALLP
jgi:hypothetical protein